MSIARMTLGVDGGMNDARRSRWSSGPRSKRCRPNSGVPRLRGVAVVLAAVAVLVAACGGSPTASGGDNSETIVATTGIWADVVGQLVCGGQAEVSQLIPDGADPHGYEASLADRGRLDDAALVVANGAGLEEGLDDTIDSVASDGTPVVRITELVDTITDEDGRVNPHLWMDPVRVSDVLAPLAARIEEELALTPGELSGCLEDTVSRISRLDTELSGLVATVPPARRLLITDHDDLPYLADRYGFTIVGSLVPSSSSLAGVDPRHLEDLADAARRSGAPAVFIEVGESSADAESLAKRAGLRVVELYIGSLGPPGSGADTWEGLLRTDMTAIVEALR